MRKRDIIRQLRESKKLPSPSRVALEIIHLCQSDASSIADITRIIETDPALTGELLRFANSALHDGSPPLISVHRAALHLGLHNVVNLALSFSLLAKNQTENCRNFDYPRFWSRSLAQAVAARAIAETQGKHDPEELFVCGLLAHIGELALASVYPDEYSDILGLLEMERDREKLTARENEIFGCDHNNVTAELLLDWGIPEEYARAVGLHERYGQEIISDRPVTELAGLLFLAQRIAEICLLELPQSGPLAPVEDLAKKFSITAEKFSPFFDQIVSRWQEFNHLFQTPTQQCPFYHQIKDFSSTPLSGEIKNLADNELKILAADDDPLTLLNLRKILAAPYRTIISADNGEEALQMAIEQQPQMLITDWRMPRINGLELCKVLRRTSLTQHIYIIMLTGCEEDDELVQAFDAGADDYVVKPFTPKVLEARIRSGERLIRYQKTVSRDRELIHRYATSLANANRKLLTMAMTDALTELPNRRSAMARINDAVAEADRFDEKLSCIMIDLDHFKEINDNYGHDSGDQVLKEVATIFAVSARSYDMVSRTGGEEFLVICSRSDQTEARQLAERLRTAVEDHEFVLKDGTGIRITISLGVATWSPACINSDGLIKAADRALYKAKLQGRNRVETTGSF
jgi:two-component system, cell cycle response regulator